jgi:hypothetical protein
VAGMLDLPGMGSLCLRRTKTAGAWGAFLLLAALCSGPAAAADLGTGRLIIAGTRLAVSPDSQTVPFNTPTIVETDLVGFEAAEGPLPSDLRALADFSGPEIDGVLVLETVPGEPFRIPRLSLKGQYQLDNIRLVQGDDLLAYAEPRSAGVLVTQVLVTRVTSRPLTLDEIRSYGVIVGDESFQAFNFTFGFAVGGKTFDYNLPVIYSPVNGGKLEILADMAQAGPGGSTGTTAPRFQPPQMAPFNLKLEPRAEGEPVPSGGCGDAEGDCFVDAPVTLPGVILFPTDVTLLHQFFSVVLLAKNDAPEGDALRIRDLAARVVLPPGLRMASTEPPTPLGVPVPIRVPGPDGKLGTGDDLTFLVAQAEGQAEVVVEGLQQGTHIVEFQLEGTLAGMPGNEVRRISGTARGAVVVRDPTLSMTITHPDVVRAGEPYTLRLTVANTSASPVNLLSISLPPTGLSGVELAPGETNQKTIATLPPGDAEVVEFDLVSRRTGKVVASSVRSASAIDPRFELVVGVGEQGIPLSPTALVLPKSTEELPDALVRHALSLLGLGWSLATAPASLTTDLPRLGLEEVHEKVYWLGQAGRHVKLGEEPFDSLSVLAMEWSGVRDRDWEWDDLRRRTQKGGLWADELGKAFSAGESSALEVFDRFAATTAFLGRIHGALAIGSTASVEVSSRTSGKVISGLGTDPTRRRELPFADLFRLDLATDGQMVTLAVPEENGYRARLRVQGGGSASLHLLVPEPDGTLRRVSWTGVVLSAAGTASADFKSSFLDSELVLKVDADGDGVEEETLPGSVSTVEPRLFTALAAVQNEIEPSGHMVEVLLTQDVDLRSLLPVDPSRFKIPGKVSNGGLVPIEEDVANFFEVLAQNPFEGLRDTRIVRVIFDNPISPLLANELTVRDLESVSGQSLTNVKLPVTTTVTDPGAQVQGTVYGPDGQPIPFAKVELLETDFFYHFPTPCRQHRTAAVEADAQGRYHFDYVRQTSCGDVFSVVGTDPGSGKHGASRARVRFVNQTMEVDVVMLGRGTIRGKVRYDNGDIPGRIDVMAYSPVFFEGREARLGPDGTYEVGDIPVGTVTLGANDRDGGYVFQTVEIPSAGAIVQRDLVIIRRPSTRPVGDVRGIVHETDNVTPVFNAYLALYINGELVGVERSGYDGRFDFGTVPAGLAEIEAFDGETGLTGAQVTFDVEPDQVNEIPIRLRDERGTVEGHVYVQTLSSVAPLAGAVIWVSGTPFNTVTDASGFYRLDGVFAGDRTILAADLGRNRQTSAVVSLTGNGQTVTRDLYFVESVGSGLTGEVVGFAGNPVSGATVHLSTGGDSWFGTAVTDSAGRFMFPNLAVGTYVVHAIKGQDGGFQQATIRFQGETPSIRIQFKKGAVRGVVRARNESGQLVGVRSLVTYRTTVVRGEMVGLDWDSHTLETNADGTFELSNVLVGRYVLTVSNAFHGEKTVRDELIFADEIANHEFVFEPNGTIRGVVLDWDGTTPAAGAQVFLRHPSFSIYDLTTDAEGKFKFELVPPGGRFPIDATINSGTISRQARVWVTFNRFGQEMDVEIRLPRQGTVTGQVEDANGTSVAGAVVTLREQGFPQRQLIQNADNQGRFSFTNIFAGRIALTAKAPSLGGLGAHANLEIVDEGEEVFALLALEATGEIAGRVLSPENGQPVATVQVSLHHGGGIFDVVTSDAEGAFRFRLLPVGDYQVWVFDPRAGRHGRSAILKVQQNNQVVERDVVLEARGNVDGHLYEPNATAGIPGATIQLQTRSLVPFHTFSSTDVDGRFVFEGIPEGEFSLSTKEPEGRRRASAEGAITEEDQNVTVDLFLEESGRVIGSVFNPAGITDGLFPNSNTLIYQDGQVVGATLQNPFEFDGIIADRGFELKAFEVGGDHRAAKAGQLAEQGEEVTVNLRMVPIGSVAVTVRDSFDNPVSGANVQVSSNGFYGHKGFSGTSAADGRVVFTGAGEGTLSVYATHPVTGLRGSGNGSIATEGQVAQIAVRLEDSGRIRGRAVKADGVTPAAEALVVVSHSARTLQTLTDADGWFTFASVPMGPFSAYVQEHLGPGSIHRGGSITANGQEVDLGVLRLDASDPYIVTLAPGSNTRDLSLSTSVAIGFNEPLDRVRFSGGWVSFRTLGGGGVAYTLTWEAGDTVMRLTPNAPLASFTGYEVIVSDGYDLAGRRLSSRARTVFHTVDVMPPNVIDVLPRDGQSQVPLNTLIKVTFSEPVTLASLSGNALQLTDLTTGQGITTTFLQLPGQREVLITPVAALENNHQYQIRVQGVQDGGGNTMPVPVMTTFWAPDTIAPQIQDVLPAEGATYTSGDRIPVAVTATDERGLGAATIAYTGWTFTDPAAPYSWSVPAPVVSEPSDVAITVKVKDIFGNESTALRTVRIEPRVNANTPQVDAGCAVNGDAVVPGVDAEFILNASDDEAIERHRFIVDGQVVKETSPVDMPAAQASFLWRPPANAAAGTSFLVRLEARDFAGNIGFHELTVSVPTGIILKGSQSLGSSRSGQALVVAGGTFLVRDRLPLASVTMLRGTTLSAPDDDPAVELEVAGALRLQCGSTVKPGLRGNVWIEAASADVVPGALIDVSLQGFPGGGEPEGVPGASGEYGSGSHGGRGWPSGNGVVYGSVVEPRLGGAGEVGAYAPGGGVVEIGVAGSFSFSGEIRGLGGDGCHGGGGAGGSVLLRGGTLRGAGLIDVSGGRESLNCSWDGGLGGGGRVAIHGTLDGFATQVRAWGGAHRGGQYHAAPGTVYYKSPGQAYGVLAIDRGETNGVDRKGVDTELPALGEGAVTAFQPIGGDAWVSRSGGFRVDWLGAWMVLLNAGGAEIQAFRVAAIDEQGRARLAGAVSVTGAASYRGEHRFDRIELLNGATLTSTSPLVVSDLSVSGDVKLSGEVRADSVTVKAGAILRPVSGGDLRFIVAGAMSIEAGALIDLSSLGYGIGAAPPGVTPASDWANGGTHGGSGGFGEFYDSVYKPWLPGAGGTGGIAPGKPGGGAVRIEAGSVQLDGEIRVRGGGTCGAEGGGAGGTVFIAATGALSGSGLIDASGGAVQVNANCGAGNAGGGGRVALQVGSFAGFDPAVQVKVQGGAGGPAGAGTLLTRTTGQAYGSLRVDQRATSGTFLATGLAVIGRGMVGATYAGAVAADLWIEPQDAAAKFGLGVAGAWTRIGGVDYRVLELSSDRRRILLEGAAGAVTAGQNYAGIYKFDSIKVTGRARVVLVDSVEVTGSTVVEAGSALDWPDGSQIANLELRGDAGLAGEVRATNVTIGSGATVRPASGGELRFVVSGVMTVEAGATVDVSDRGYSGAKPGHADGYAPDGVPGATGTYAGGAHGGRGLHGTSQVFDSVYEPRLGGGGGAWGTTGGTAGGGVLRIEAGQLVLDGKLRSSSSKPCSAGGGAGGTVAVMAGSMSGSGSIDASGSDEPQFSECNFDAGAGGGGRVALSVGSFVGFDPSVQAKAWGGRPYGGSNPSYAAPGTVYYRVAGQEWGVLLIDNGQENGVNRAGLLTELPVLGSGDLAGFAAAGINAWVSRSGGFAASWRGAWMVLRNAAGTSLGVFRVADLDSQGRALLTGAWSVAGASKYAGEYRFDRIDVLHGSSYNASDPVTGAELVLEGDLQVASEIRGVDVRIKAGANVRPATGGELRIIATGTVTIEAGALIDLSSRGYGIGAAPPGVTPASGYANGGTHGGSGGLGEFYDSVYEPWLAGAGGTGGNASGKPGGGVVRIEANNVQLDGQIRVRGGETCNGEGGGAGGAVFIAAAGTLSGSGLIDATGGSIKVNANCNAGNPGGGGRVALRVGSFAGFDPALQVEVRGGIGDQTDDAGAGTLLTRTTEQAYGSLHVDRRATSGTFMATGLAVIGRGTIGATYPGANAADLWIEPQDGAAKFGLGVAGAWTRINGVDYRILDLSSDRRRILLQGAAAAVAAGQAYAGLYRFDSISVAGRAHLDLKDLVIVTGGTNVEGGSKLSTADDSELGDLELRNEAGLKGKMRVDNLVVRSGALVRPASGSELWIVALGEMTVETGAVMDVSSLGYSLGSAPPGLKPAAGWANGGTHGGVGGEGEIYDSVYKPWLPGAGGISGGGHGGGFGGGVVHLEASALRLDGAIRARGQRACGGGGGAGGAVFVQVSGPLSGSGLIDAAGGESHAAYCNPGNGGGGGRVALHVGSFAGFDAPAQVRVEGGGGVASAGTLLTRTATQIYGSLRVDQRGTSAVYFTTGLPTIGRGTIGATYPGTNAADLWIEPQDTEVKFGLGVAGIWTRVNGIDYPVLELSADRRRVLLQGAAGAVTVGQRYVGIYKFDSLSVAGWEELVLKDGLVVASTPSVQSGSTLTLLDIDSPVVSITQPAAGVVFTSGESITVKATVTDASAIASVTFQMGGQSFTDTTAPYEWTVAAPVVETEGDLSIVVKAQDAPTNEATAIRTIRIRPLAPGNLPLVTLTCPTPGALLAPGTGLDFYVTATHDNGIEKVELLLGAESLVTDFTAPYVLRFTAPAGALAGQVLQVKVRARAFSGNTAELTFPVTVVAGSVLTADRTLSPADLSLDGQSVIVAGGTLIVQGLHNFRDLVVLDGAKVTHSETTSVQVQSLTLGVERDLYLACGASIDVVGRGYEGAAANQRAYGYPNSQAEGAQVQAGGSHGGRGGRFDGSSPVYGNLFDPQAPGAGGGYDGSTKGRDGGGVVRVTALGDVVLDGVLLADGETGSSGGGAGGSVMIHAETLSGAGRIQANGSAGSNANSGGGSGGRVALYAASIDASLLGRTTAAGTKTASTDASRWGAAGTVYVQRDADPFGELIIDNKGTASTQLTDLPAVRRGVVDAVGVAEFTDNEADFRHGLAGFEVAFNDDLSILYPVQGHSHHGQTLALQVPVPPLSALIEPGDTYRGVARFDRVTVRGGARVLSVDRVESTVSPAVESGSQWTESYVPVLQLTSPAAGATFTAGDPVSIAATVQDVLGVLDVVFRLGAQTNTDAASPYAWTVVAPSVTVPTDLEVSATAIDHSGNRMVQTFTVQVLPSSDAIAPVVTLTGCVATNDAVVPGVAVALPFLMVDDRRIEKYSLRVDGQVVQTIPAAEVSVSSTWTWTPPANAAAGQAFALQIDAVDYGGSVGTASIALRIPSTPARTGTQTLTAALDGTDVFLATGTFTVQGTFAPASLTLLPGAKLTGVAGQVVKIASAGDVRVQCGALVDATGLGYPGTTASNGAGGAPAGVTPSVVDAGGSHGGPGSIWIAGPPGAVFDSVYEPSLGGGGGSLVQAYSGNRSGAGGGVIDITAGHLRLAGELRAKGEERPNRNSDTPGAGGTIKVRAGILSGAGTIDASGGKYDVQYYGGGSGGGGRVALYIDSFAGFNPLAQVKAWGGFVDNPNDSAWNRYAAPGTVFLKQPGDTYGRLVIDSGEATSGVDRIGPVTPLPTLGGGVVTSTEVAGADRWVAGASAFKAQWLGAWMDLLSSSGGLAGSYQVRAIDSGGRVLLANAASASSAATYQGVYLFDRIDLRNGAGLSASDPIETAAMQTDGNVRLPAGMTAEALTLKAGTVIPAAGGTLQLHVTGTLTVEAGAVLDVTGKGYPGTTLANSAGGAPAGVTPSAVDAGGSHGGPGSIWVAGPAGAVYDSVYEPSLGGGGGSLYKAYSANRSGAGGGVIDITAGHLVLDGQLRARGEERPRRDSDTPGAGGTVKLRAGTLSGTGTIDASGGKYDVQYHGGGSGGGGRVALYVNSFAGFDPLVQVKAWGGFVDNPNDSTWNRYAAPGTLFIKSLGDTYGRLVIDSGEASPGVDRVGPVTPLPLLGSGAVTAVEAASPDLWVAGPAAFKTQWLGAWMELLSSSGSSLGTFRAVALDGAGRARLAGASGAAAAASFRGLYLFDRLDLRNGAGLSSDDPLDVGTMQTDGNARLPVKMMADELTLKAGGTVTPALGGTLHLQVTGTLTVEAGAVLDVTGKGYPGTSLSNGAGGAPAGISPAVVDGGGSHGGLGSVWVAGPPGAVFDSVYEPSLGGGGGSLVHAYSGYRSGAGGGVINITAGLLVLAGELRAKGEVRPNRNSDTPGAGGTVMVRAGVLTGAGTIDASGGKYDVQYYGGGSGGGGRVALYVDGLQGFDPVLQVNARGGAANVGTPNRYAGAGTIFVKLLSQPFGRLIVDQGGTGGLSVRNTPLPSIGIGTVGLTEAHAGDPGALWIEPADSATKFSLGTLGMWVRIDGSDYRVIGQTADLRRLLLDDAAGVVDVGDSYRGVYKFDEVTVRGGAKLEFRDTNEVGTWNVDPTSSVIQNVP